MSFQITALLAYGGKILPFAIGAVVVGVEIACQTPLSGHLSPVLPVVPRGKAILNLLKSKSWVPHTMFGISA